jgi:PAS domain S-box-containing protein
MSESKSPSSSEPSVVAGIPSETVDVQRLSSPTVTDSGSFDLRDFRTTSLGRILNTVPLPALMVNESLDIMFANESSKRIGLNWQDLSVPSLAAMFPKQHHRDRAVRLVERVLSRRVRGSCIAKIGLDDDFIWGRLHCRSLRLLSQRTALVLIEDLTFLKNQVVEARKHEKKLKAVQSGVEDEIGRKSDELEELQVRLKRAQEQVRKQVSEKDQLAAMLSTSEKKYLDRLASKPEGEHARSTLLDAGPDPILICDESGNVVYANKSFAEVFGWTLDEMEGNPPPFIPEVELRSYESFYESLLQSEDPARSVDSKRLTRDGRVLDVSMSASRHVGGSEGPGGVFFILRDATATQRAERALLQTEHIKAVGELVGGIAHVFNNLLQVVLTNLEMALAGLRAGNPAEVEEQLARALRSAELQADTVKRLQDFAFVRSREDVDSGEVFDASEAAEKAIEMARPWWKKKPERKGLKIPLFRYLETGCFVQCSENDLTGIVVNLIKNAAEALPQGGEVKVKTVIDDGEVVLQVQDDGIGMTPEERSKAFNPFWTTKEPPAAGLGLASAIGVVKRHHGEIHLESVPHRGTSVTVRLPLAEPPHEETDRQDRVREDESLRILVVDDEESITRAMKEALVELGHQVSIAGSGKEALELFKPGSVDAVLCDLAMPDMNGWQVGKALKSMCADQSCEKPRFLIFTGWRGEPVDKQQVDECGVDAVIEKPVRLTQLIEALHNGYDGAGQGADEQKS